MKTSALIAAVLITSGQMPAPAGAGAGAQNGRQVAAAAGMPVALKRAALATRSDRSGRMAGARIGGTDTWIVYMQTTGGCGSGGCRAQVWKREGARFVRGESMPVGRLPITVLPETVNDMPVLGVTIFDKNSGKDVILPVAFDGQSYMEQMHNSLLPANAGRPLLTEAMMRPF